MNLLDRLRETLRISARTSARVVLELTRPSPGSPPQPQEEDWEEARAKMGSFDPTVIYIPEYTESLRLLAVRCAQRRKKNEKLRARRKRARDRKKALK